MLHPPAAASIAVLVLALVCAGCPPRKPSAPVPSGRSPAAALAVDRLRVAEDLLELGFAETALEEYREILKVAVGRDELVRAWYGVARSQLRAEGFEQARETYRDIAARHPEEQKNVALLLFRGYRDRFEWREALELARELDRRKDLLQGERAEVQSALAYVASQLELQPVLDERFDAPLGPGWLLTNPLRARWNAARGDVEVRVGGGVESTGLIGLEETGAPASSAPAFGPASLIAAVPWRGESFSFTVDWKVLDVEPGATVRIGLAPYIPRTSQGRGKSADRVALELSAQSDESGAVAVPRRYPLALVVALGEERMERATPPSEPGFSLDVWYRATVEYVQALSRLRVEVVERASLTPGAVTESRAASVEPVVRPEGGARESAASEVARPARVCPVFRAELVLPRPFAPDDYFFGLIAPADEPEGAPATVFVDAVRFRTSPAAAERAAPSIPDLAEEEFLMGNAAASSGSLGEARLHYARAIAADPFLEAAIFADGLAARDASETLAAARSFASVLRTIPRAREEFRRVAAELAARGSREDLLVALDSFLAVDPDDAGVRAAAEDARRRVVDSLAQEAVSSGGFGVADRLRRSRLFLIARDTASALAEATLAVERVAADPQRIAGEVSRELAVAAFRARAEAYFARGEFARAFLDYTRASRFEPGDVESLLGLARVLIAWAARAAPAEAPAGAPVGADGRPEAAAISVLQRAEKLAPDRAELYLLRARARLALGQLEEARADAERAATLKPRSAEVHAVAAAIALRDGRREDARRSIQRAARLGVVDPSLAAAVGRGD